MGFCEGKKKNFFKIFLIIGFLASLVFLGIVLNAKNTLQEQGIISNPQMETEGIYKKFISGSEYCVPRSYLRSGSDDKSESLLLYVVFPEMKPDTDGYYSQEEGGIGYNRLKVLILSQKDMRPLEEVAEERKEFLQVKSVATDTEGLNFFKQPENASNDSGDLYTEEKEGRLLSYIACSKEITSISVPQCVQSRFYKNLSLQITYDKRLLPEWKSMDDKTTDLIDSFKCK